MICGAVARNGGAVVRFRQAAYIVISTAVGLLACHPSARPEAAIAAPLEAADAGARECHADSECALTRYLEGACCESLCVPRAISATALAAQADFVRRCGVKCAVPQCRPESADFSAICSAGRCQVRAQPGSRN
jgi:hypothetical protein